MKTKLQLIGLLLCVIILFPSCEKWFDVTADDQIKAEDQFSTADGFHDALMGVYLSATSNQLYGMNMTFNIMDILGQQYLGFTSNLALYSDFQSYNYTQPRSQSYIENIWNKYYFSIANTNSALQQLDLSTIKWYKGEKEIIKGELLALRAFLHFDLMRTFGHSGFVNRPELKNRLAIPYSRTYSKDFAPQLSYAETLTLMESDLNEALDLLKFDPVYKNSQLTPEQLADINQDGFYNKRQMRMNYYAVKALQARVYAWQGGEKMAKAAEAAEEVINDSFATLLASGTNVINDRKMSSEQLFSLEVSNLNVVALAFFEGNQNTNYIALRMAPLTTEQLFETAVPEIGGLDVRFNTLIVSEPLGMISIKHRYENPLALGATLMPLIKLPEMYYIAAEYYSKQDMNKAVQYLQAVRSSRRITQQLPTTMDLSTFDAELIKEYRKEFIAEGQLFFFYKRKGLTQIPNYSSDVVADDKIYMLPYPAAEIEFGNRVQ